MLCCYVVASVTEPGDPTLRGISRPSGEGRGGAGLETEGEGRLSCRGWGEESEKWEMLKKAKKAKVDNDQFKLLKDFVR